MGYNLATATGTYSSTTTPASWVFSADELNASCGTTKTMGIIVDDYSTKPAGTYQDTVTFTAAVVDASKAVTGVTLDKTTATITVGNTEMLTATVAPDDATDKTVTWTSSNESVATVANGVVTAVATGTATITATAGGQSATCAVTVVAPQYADKLREASKYTGDFDDAGFWDWSNDGLDGQTITKEQGLALAQYQKQQTGSPCAIMYDGNDSQDGGSLYYVKDDGTSGAVWWGDNIAGSVLSGYKLYCVNK